MEETNGSAEIAVETEKTKKVSYYEVMFRGRAGTLRLSKSKIAFKPSSSDNNSEASIKHEAWRWQGVHKYRTTKKKSEESKALLKLISRGSPARSLIFQFSDFEQLQDARDVVIENLRESRRLVLSTKGIDFQATSAFASQTDDESKLLDISRDNTLNDTMDSIEFNESWISHSEAEDFSTRDSTKNVEFLMMPTVTESEGVEDKNEESSEKRDANEKDQEFLQPTTKLNTDEVTEENTASDSSDTASSETDQKKSTGVENRDATEKATLLEDDGKMATKKENDEDAASKDTMEPNIEPEYPALEMMMSNTNATLDVITESDSFHATENEKGPNKIEVGAKKEVKATKHNDSDSVTTTASSDVDSTHHDNATTNESELCKLVVEETENENDEANDSSGLDRVLASPNKTPVPLDNREIPKNSKFAASILSSIDMGAAANDTVSAVHKKQKARRCSASNIFAGTAPPPKEKPTTARSKNYLGAIALVSLLCMSLSLLMIAGPAEPLRSKALDYVSTFGASLRSIYHDLKLKQGESTETLNTKVAEKMKRDQEVKKKEQEAKKKMFEATQQRMQEEREQRRKQQEAKQRKIEKAAATKRLKMEEEAEAARRAAEVKRLAKLEEVRLAKEERERQESLRLAEEKKKAAEAKRLADLEAERLAKEEQERHAKLEQERLEAQSFAEEQKKVELEAARLAMEEKRRLEAQKLAEEQKKAAEEQKRAELEAARLAKEEHERIAKEKQEKLKAQRLAEEQKKAELEAARLAKEEQERLDALRIAEEKKKAELEAARLAKEEEARLEAQRLEGQKRATEARRQAELEAVRLAKEEQERLESQRLAEEQKKAELEAARLAAKLRMDQEAAAAAKERLQKGTSGKEKKREQFCWRLEDNETFCTYRVPRMLQSK